MRRIALILLTVLLFGIGLACDSGSCSDNDSGGTAGLCSAGRYPLWNEERTGYVCLRECPDGTLLMPNSSGYECARLCSDGSAPSWNWQKGDWECDEDPTATPTATATPTGTATATSTATATATDYPTPTATATATPTATAESNCINGTWTGTSKSNIGWGDQTLTFNITSNGKSISGSVKHVSDGTSWSHSASGTIGSVDPPTTFKFSNSSETTYTGTFVNCNKIVGTYTDVHGDSGTFTMTK